MAKPEDVRKGNEKHLGRSRAQDAMPHDLAVALVGGLASGAAAEGAKRLFNKMSNLSKTKAKPKPSPRKSTK